MKWLLVRRRSNGEWISLMEYPAVCLHQANEDRKKAIERYEDDPDIQVFLLAPA